MGAQVRSTVGFWNVENLFDTIQNPAYRDDDNFIPPYWSAERYLNKQKNIAAIIDEMNLDVLGLCEVENEEVVRDLIKTLKTDYNYIHRTAGRGGRDVVLLYKGDRFVPDSVATIPSRTARSFLYVRGRLRGQRVDIVVCHMPSMLNNNEYRDRAAKRLHSFADSLLCADDRARLIIMGDMNATPRDRVIRNNISDSLFCPLEAAAARGEGTYAHSNRWLLYDNIFLCNRLLDDFSAASIYIKPHLLYDDPKLKRHGTPRRTFTNGRYTNGLSDHLPVFAVFN